MYGKSRKKEYQNENSSHAISHKNAILYASYIKEKKGGRKKDTEFSYDLFFGSTELMRTYACMFSAYSNGGHKHFRSRARKQIHVEVSRHCKSDILTLRESNILLFSTLRNSSIKWITSYFVRLLFSLLFFFKSIHLFSLPPSYRIWYFFDALVQLPIFISLVIPSRLIKAFSCFSKMCSKYHQRFYNTYTFKFIHLSIFMTESIYYRYNTQPRM